MKSALKIIMALIIYFLITFFIKYFLESSFIYKNLTNIFIPPIKSIENTIGQDVLGLNINNIISLAEKNNIKYRYVDEDEVNFYNCIFGTNSKGLIELIIFRKNVLLELSLARSYIHINSTNVSYRISTSLDIVPMGDRAGPPPKTLFNPEINSFNYCKLALDL